MRWQPAVQMGGKSRMITPLLIDLQRMNPSVETTPFWLPRSPQNSRKTLPAAAGLDANTCHTSHAGEFSTCLQCVLEMCDEFDDA
jgi:hypothetical protein